MACVQMFIPTQFDSVEWYLINVSGQLSFENNCWKVDGRVINVEINEGMYMRLQLNFRNHFNCIFISKPVCLARQV